MQRPYPQYIHIEHHADGCTFNVTLTVAIPHELADHEVSGDKYFHVTSEIERLFSGWIKSQLDKNPPTD